MIAGGVLYAGSPDNQLATVDAANGHRLAFTPGHQVAGHAVVDDGWLYLTDGNQLCGYTVPRTGPVPAGAAQSMR